MAMYHIVKEASLLVDMNSTTRLPRTLYSVLTSATSELGELAEEVMIAEGNSYKAPGKDGIVGEAIDTIQCLLDIIHLANPKLRESDINAMMQAKCNKWIDKATQHKSGCICARCEDFI